MQLTKFSNFQKIDSAGTNLTKADMLNRDFSTIVQHKTLPPTIEISQLKPNNSLKRINF